MKLQEFLEKSKMNILDFAAISGIPYSVVHGLVNDKRKTCTIETAFRIMVATEMSVKSTDLIADLKLKKIQAGIEKRKIKFMEKKNENVK